MRDFAKDFCKELIEKKIFFSNDGSQRTLNGQQNSTGECGSYRVKKTNYQMGIGITFDSNACNLDGKHSDDKWLNGVGMKEFGLKACVKAIGDDIPGSCMLPPPLVGGFSFQDLSHGGSAWNHCLRFSAIAYNNNSGQSVPDTIHIST